MRRSCTSPTALISGSFFSEEAPVVDAPASGISVAVVGTVVVAGTSVVVGTSIEMSASGALLLHVTAVAYIETTPRQTATFVDR